MQEPRGPLEAPKLQDHQEKIQESEPMITDIKFGLDQDKNKNSVLNLQVHVPPNQDHQTLNFCFYGDASQLPSSINKSPSDTSKEERSKGNEYKPFMSSP